MDIQQILNQIKTDYEDAVTKASFNNKNGNEAKQSLIRSGAIINLLHEFIKNQFVEAGVSKEMIYPPLNQSKPEIKLKGFLKPKYQDIVIVPDEKLLSIAGGYDKENEKIISVNVRSQLSSLAKNIDTLYERTFAEAFNLHLSYPLQCLGEVYLIPAYQYDDKAMSENKIAFKSVSKIEDYIRMFQAINKREDTSKDLYKYERVCLLIVDFKQKTPKLYGDISELQKDGLLPQNSAVSLDNLTINNFAKDLIDIYENRFKTKISTHTS